MLQLHRRQMVHNNHDLRQQLTLTASPFYKWSDI